MLRAARFALVAAAVLVLAACGTGQVRRISEPAASIQQLTVRADGGWSIELRLQNYSTVPMRFDATALEMTVDGTVAGTVALAQPFTVGPESADVVAVTLAPDPQARLLMAGALADGRGPAYLLEGTVTAAPADRGKARDYRIRRNSALSPVPGLPGVLR